MTEVATIRTVVLISANAEWKEILISFPASDLQSSPLGAWFTVELSIEGQAEQVIFFHGGWGKIAAAASTQYVIDRWSPRLLINLGTCGGFEGDIEKGTVILAERTVVYDIIEMMSDYEGAIKAYTTAIDLSWLNGTYPHDVKRGLLVSADRDLQIEDIPALRSRYGAIAGDWESGAIAYVAARNNVRSLILRGVSDLVGTAGEAYGNIAIFQEGTRNVLDTLLRYLPAWIALASR
jgi:adenosylhomocysteine nucleosidase